MCSVLSHFSCVQLFATPWTIAHRVRLTVGILQARILEWVAMPSSRGSPNPGIEPTSAALQADSLPSESPGKPIKCNILYQIHQLHYINEHSKLLTLAHLFLGTLLIFIIKRYVNKYLEITLPCFVWIDFIFKILFSFRSKFYK